MAKDEVYRIYNTKLEFDKCVNTLIGLLNGIISNNIINGKEIEFLKKWLSENHLNKKPLVDLHYILEDLIDNNSLSIEDLQDMIWVLDNVSLNKNNIVKTELQILDGIINGILADIVLDDTEINVLSNWIETHTELKGYFPYDELDTIITDILKDGIITENERIELKAFLSDFLNTSYLNNCDKLELENIKKENTVQGICSVDPEINIENKLFCFTGASDKVSRSEIADIVVSKGGVFHDSVVKNTDYLIVGCEGSSCWVYSCYGRKIEKAVKLRKEGHPIKIIHEKDFWDKLQDY